MRQVSIKPKCTWAWLLNRSRLDKDVEKVHYTVKSYNDTLIFSEYL